MTRICRVCKPASSEKADHGVSIGAIVVNNEKATADTILKNGDLISNVLHRYERESSFRNIGPESDASCFSLQRHEPPVVAGPIKIIYDGRLPGNDGETLVVEKPGSMPVSKADFTV